MAMTGKRCEHETLIEERRAEPTRVKWTESDVLERAMSGRHGTNETQGRLAKRRRIVAIADVYLLAH
jgi:hypothetical protein